MLLNTLVLSGARTSASGVGNWLRSPGLHAPDFIC